MFGLPIEVISALTRFYGAAGDIYAQLQEAMSDGEITSKEADEIGLTVAKTLGDIQIRVKGKDVVHMPAQKLICRGLARICRQVILAKTEG
jgi:hypothetical protein